MKQKTVLILGMAGIAAYLVYSRKERLMHEDPCFREGYIAGFFTPGPITLIALAGGIYLYV